MVPFMNWTVPVALRGATLARKITGMPWKARFGNTLSVVDVAFAPLGVIAIPYGWVPTGIGVPGVLVATSIGVTVPLSVLVT
jgi:hypothetical protein